MRSPAALNGISLRVRSRCVNEVLRRRHSQRASAPSAPRPFRAKFSSARVVPLASERAQATLCAPAGPKALRLRSREMMMLPCITASTTLPTATDPILLSDRSKCWSVLQCRTAAANSLPLESSRPLDRKPSLTSTRLVAMAAANSDTAAGREPTVIGVPCNADMSGSRFRSRTKCTATHSALRSNNSATPNRPGGSRSAGSGVSSRNSLGNDRAWLLLSVSPSTFPTSSGVIGPKLKHCEKEGCRS
mmetsp:Transcript_56158/g.182245  ORF Transcript_56158/g.182245 Transcript_56158/m.182245 type:complete len:247 (+) Transcript_56158:1312-2052(+)